MPLRGKIRKTRKNERTRTSSYESVMRTLLLQNQQIIIQQQNMMFMLMKQHYPAAATAAAAAPTAVGNMMMATHQHQPTTSASTAQLPHDALGHQHQPPQQAQHLPQHQPQIQAQQHQQQPPQAQHQQPTLPSQQQQQSQQHHHMQMDDTLSALLENDSLMSNNILYNPSTDIGSITPYKNHHQQESSDHHDSPPYYSSESLTTPRMETQTRPQTTVNVSQNVVKNLNDSFKSPTKPKINVQILSNSATREMKNSKAKIIQSMNISEFLRQVHHDESVRSSQ